MDLFFFFLLKPILLVVLLIVVQNLSQLASINYDLLSKGFKDDPSGNPSG